MFGHSSTLAVLVFIYVIQAIVLPEKALTEINTLLYRFLWRKKIAIGAPLRKLKE